MRSFIVFFLLILMLAGLGVLLGMRARQPHQMPAETVTARSDSADGGSTTSDGGSAEAVEAGAATPDGSPREARDGGTTDGAVEAGPEKLMDRPMRVIGQGWDVISPALVANRGTAPGEESLFTAQGLEVHFRSATKVVDLERALARGGADEDGADVAVMPLTTFVASYEQLRALNPLIFYVVGWSNGREALLASREDPLTQLPRSGDIRLVGESGSTAVYLALFALDLAGVSLSRVSLVEPDSAQAENVVMAAVTREGREQRPTTSSRSFVLTTADATRLIPFVAVAPQGFIQSESDALRAFCSTWQAGVQELNRDVPASARRIASIEGAPEALELLGGLGRIESASLRENAQVVGLSGRGAVTISILFQRAWRIWRDANVISSPALDTTPVTGDVIVALVHAGSSMADPPPSTVGADQEGNEGGRGSSGSEVILVHRLEGRRLDEDLLVSQLGFLAGVFEPLPLRVSIPNESNSNMRDLIGRARDRYGLDEERISSSRRLDGPRAPAAIALLTPP